MANMNIVTGHTGEAHVSAVDARNFNVGTMFYGDCVLPINDEFELDIVDANNLTIHSGDGIFQGTHFRIASGDTVSLSLVSGTAGYYRHDLVCAEYTKDDDGTEAMNLVVIEGTAAATSSAAADPEYDTGDVQNGQAAKADFPLWRIIINGLVPESSEQLFTIASASDIMNDLGTNTATITDSMHLAMRDGTGKWKRQQFSYLWTYIKGKISSVLGLTATAYSGKAATATKLATSRTIQTNLASTDVASFNGSANVTPGVTGVLPVANGGTGNSTGAAASCSGNSATATKLTTSAGSANTPVYFSDGKPVACTNSNISVNYATSAGTAAACSGNSATATKLTTSAGSANQPVYFSDGKPVAGDYVFDVYTENNSDTWVLVFNGGKLQHTSLERFLEKTGGTMTGDLYVPTIYVTNTTTGVHANAFFGINDSTRGRLQATEWYCRNADSTSWATFYASSFSAQSSRLVKKNIEDMSEDEARKLLELRPVTFDYNNEANGTNCRGLIAEEVEDIIPSCVTKPVDCATTEDGLNDEQTNTLGIDYSKLVPYLIKMLQIQEARIQALEAQ